MMDKKEFAQYLLKVAASEGILTEAAEALIDAARVIEEQEEELRRLRKDGADNDR